MKRIDKKMKAMDKSMDKKEREFQLAIDNAKAVNRARDVIDRQHGHAAPMDCPADIQVRTVQDAIRAGMMMKDWTCIAEAWAMLDDYLATLPRTTMETRDA